MARLDRHEDFPMLHDGTLQTIICTTRLAQAVEFYRGVLGLKLVQSANGTAVFDVNGSTLRVSQVASLVPSVHTAMGFAVADIDRIVDGLVARGVVVERMPAWPHDARGILTTPTGERVAWLKDPDGNLLSIVKFA